MWIVTLVAWWRERVKRNGQGQEMEKKDTGKFESERKAMQGVMAACMEQSAEKTRAALLQWASIKQEGRPCRSLGMVAHIMNQPVSDPTEISAAIWNQRSASRSANLVLTSARNPGSVSDPSPFSAVRSGP